MLRPAIAEELRDNQNIFALVIAISKRAREITDDIEKKKHFLTERGGKISDLADFETYLDTKPVRMAVDQFSNGNFNFVYSDVRDL
jgi:DNA-directed RNA polymerase subunit omega